MNTVCHIEFDVTDLDRAETFYRAVFGWSFRPFTPTMRAFGHGDAHIGGLQLAEEVRPGRSPSVWIQVSDLDGTLARTREAGGEVLASRSEVPSVGWSALLADPDGNPVGVVQYE